MKISIQIVFSKMLYFPLSNGKLVVTLILKDTGVTSSWKDDFYFRISLYDRQYLNIRQRLWLLFTKSQLSGEGRTVCFPVLI